MLERKVTTTTTTTSHMHIYVWVFIVVLGSTGRILVSNAAPLAKISQQQQASSSSNIIESEHYIHVVANDCLVVEQTLNKLNQLLEQALKRQRKRENERSSSSLLKVHVIRTLSESNATTSVPTCLINVEMTDTSAASNKNNKNGDNTVVRDDDDDDPSTYGFNFVILVKLLRYVSLNYDNWLLDYDSEHDHQQQQQQQQQAGGSANSVISSPSTNLVSNLNFRCQGHADSDDDYPYARHATLRMDRITNALVKSMYGSLMASDLSGCESSTSEINESDRLDIGTFVYSNFLYIT